MATVHSVQCVCVHVGALNHYYMAYDEMQSKTEIEVQNGTLV